MRINRRHFLQGTAGALSAIALISVQSLSARVAWLQFSVGERSPNLET